MSKTDGDVEMPNTTVVASGVTASNTSGGAGASGSNLPMYQQEKVGQRCCGCCCDYRRACIIVGIIFAIYNGIVLVLSIIGTSVPGTVNNVNDDQAQDLINDRGLYILIISAIGFFFSFVAIFGAMWYNIWMLAINILWFLVAYGVNIWANEVTIDRINELPSQSTTYRSPIGLYIIQAIVTMLWCYPFFGLINEIKKGIMSKETYPREEYSCCCTNKH
eukprot:CAMPEP_0113459552 /NCGR_PEP_ID=MMETSP0014_2-20120614/10514_1 /TAXON_ID=2857 /ORGANISM="Nitzschia sp." /LENGTH=218 /DNA_ID=CAMNT_0000351145 /DNA_START=91 /DNA_END=747 /DNA_ORIENTATION=+ /assembly_acc=CAM_ASM_000159